MGDYQVMTCTNHLRASISTVRVSLLILNFVFGLSHQSYQHQLCVVGNGYNRTDSSLEHCSFSYPISHFARYYSNYSKSDTIVTFFGKNHTLNGTWEWLNVRHITFRAHNQFKILITCLPNILDGSGFKFLNVSMLNMAGLSITECGLHWKINSSHSHLNFPSDVVSAVLIAHGSSIWLTNIEILNSRVAGLFVYNVAGNSVIDSCTINNARHNETEALSGNIIAYDLDLSANLTIQSSTISNCGYRYETGNCSDYKYSSGLALFIGNKELSLVISDTTLHDNTGCNGGNMVLLLFSFPENNSKRPMISFDHVTFENGSSLVGGGLYISFENTFLNTNSSSENKIASVFNISHSTFKDNFAKLYGGGIMLQWMEALGNEFILDNYMINTTFDGNSLGINGSGGLGLHYKTYIVNLNTEHKITRLRVNLRLIGCSFFNHNPNIKEEELRSESSVILAKSVPYLNISDLEISSNNCTALLAIDTNIAFSGSSRIHDNKAISGAGIRLCAGALIYLYPHTDLVISNNVADQTGGGILVNSKCLVNVPMCFYQFSNTIIHNPDLLDTVNVTISGNKADRAGMNIYGGSIDYCYLLYVHRKNRTFFNRLQVPNNTNSFPSSISSNPQHVCFKEGPKLCGKMLYRSIYPGQKVSCAVQVVGQVNGAVPGTVSAQAGKGAVIARTDEVKTIKGIKNVDFTYVIYSSTKNIPTDNVTLSLKVDLQSDTSTHEYLRRFLPAVIEIKFKSCPFGFTLLPSAEHTNDTDKSKFICKCPERKKIGECSIENSSITKKQSSWVGKFEVDGVDYLAMSNFCPLDYCNDHEELSVESHDIHQDRQCRYNRTGVLCGSCSEGLSSILGSSDCRICSNVWLLITIPLALVGLLLVVVINFLNLTVTMGTVCGVIFYANIIQDHAIILFNHHPIPILTPILRAFIAWFNLDLGIPLCYYNGMEAFGKTMFQSIFPLYIWLISAIIIVLSNRYIFITRVAGRNSIKVLATLILLSYPKMLRVTLGSLNMSEIVYFVNGTKQHSIRWILDGNIEYFDIQKHLVLIVLGAIFVIFTLPFALSLLCIRYIFSLSNYCRAFSWINKLKPFFDTYTGPYKDSASFWTGLLLVVRLVLLLIHTVDYSSNYSPYTITLFILTILLALMIMMNGIYKKQHLNILECSYIINMAVIMILLVTEIQSWKVIVIHLLISIALITFLGILVFHIYLRCPSKFEWLRKVSRHRENFDVRSCEGMRGYENIEESNEEEYMEASDRLVHFPPLDIPSYSAYEKSRSFQKNKM